MLPSGTCEGRCQRQRIGMTRSRRARHSWFSVTDRRAAAVRQRAGGHDADPTDPRTAGGLGARGSLPTLALSILTRNRYARRRRCDHRQGGIHQPGLDQRAAEALAKLTRNTWSPLPVDCTSVWRRVRSGCTRCLLRSSPDADLGDRDDLAPWPCQLSRCWRRSPRAPPNVWISEPRSAW